MKLHRIAENRNESLKRRVISCLWISLALQMVGAQDQGDVGIPSSPSEWVQQGIGMPTAVTFSPTAYGPIYTGSENGIVAALSRKTGDLQWRTLPATYDFKILRMLQDPLDRYLVTLTTDTLGTNFVRVYESSTGTMLWQAQTCTPSDPASTSDVQFLVTDKIAVLECNGNISIRRSGNGEVIANVAECEAFEQFLALGVWQDDKDVVHLGTIGRNTKTFTTITAEIDVDVEADSASVKPVGVKNAKEYEQLKACSRIGLTQITPSKYACASEDALYLFDMKSQEGREVSRGGVYKIDSSFPLPSDILVYRDHTGIVNLIQLDNFEVATLDQTHLLSDELSSYADRVIIPTVEESGMGIEIATFSASTRESVFFDLTKKIHGPSSSCFVNGLTSEALVVTATADVIMINFDEDSEDVGIKWQRPESLSQVTSATFSDSPVTTQKSTDDVLRKVIEKLKDWDLSQRLISPSSEEEERMIVVTTSKAKALGISSRTGEIVWSRTIGDPAIACTRTLYKLSNDRVALVCSAHWQTTIDIVDMMTGEEVAEPFMDRVAVANVAVLENSLLLLLATGDHLLVPKGEKDTTEDLFWMMTNSGGESIYGYRAGDDDGQMQGGWQIRPPSGERFASIASIPAEGMFIASPARRTGERKVLPKYINRLASAAITEPEPGHEGVTVYLIDGPSGMIVDSIHHENATGPSYVVRCENWIVYSFWHTKSKGQMLYVADYYEKRKRWLSQKIGPALLNAAIGADVNEVETVKSHQLPPAIPSRLGFHVDARISGIGVTATELGITMRNLLLIVDNSRVVAVPKAQLEPRRPHPSDVKQEHKEEMLQPYNPHMSLLVQIPYVTRHHVLANLKQVFSAPVKGRESSSHILATGVDVFYTVLAPVGKFDGLTSWQYSWQHYF